MSKAKQQEERGLNVGADEKAYWAVYGVTINRIPHSAGAGAPQGGQQAQTHADGNKHAIQNCRNQVVRKFKDGIGKHGGNSYDADFKAYKNKGKVDDKAKKRKDADAAEKDKEDPRIAKHFKNKKWA